MGILSARAIDFGSLISNSGICSYKVKEDKDKQKRMLLSFRRRKGWVTN
jgi:hypothetical protein